MARFQSFEEKADPSQGETRLNLLREELKKRGLDGFLVPRADEFQSEYTPPYAERLAWLTGFTGSAGNALVLLDGAVIVVDGRYTVQVREQVDVSVIEPVALKDLSLEDWIGLHVPKGSILAYDPWLHTVEGVKKLQAATAKAEAMLVAVESNLIDEIWTDRPDKMAALVTLHPLKYSGENTEVKIQRVQKSLSDIGCEALLISDPHALAWVFNIRGGDVAHTPLALGYGLIKQADKAVLFYDDEQISDTVRSALAAYVDFEPKERMPEILDDLGSREARVRFDKTTASQAVVRRLEAAGGMADIDVDPIALMKARKNYIEIEGARRAHKWDGLAMIRFLSWLDKHAPGGALTEKDTVEALEQFRLECGPMRDVSFPTIAGAGPNSAICHYRVTNQTNRELKKDEIFLIDSGAQYEDGTTDITRTVIVGNPTYEMRERFTLVLKGMIALSLAVFPKGTSGAQLDSLARQFLWRHGLDFDHGTGHGIGSYLSVHEGPQRIAKIGHIPLETGMIISNEPGYYKEGAYGIRIENLLLVEKREIPGAEQEFYGFETLTFTPIDTRLVEPRFMTQEELHWLNNYHKKVFSFYGNDVDQETKDWLAHATRPIA